MDPLTAYAAAQAAVAGIKGAVALGKDINGLIGEFSKFFHMAEQVHIGATKKKIESIKKSDSQIASEALEIAWASKKLREDERYLKDMLIWSGNGDVYDQMLAERIRMSKERAEIERKEEELKQKNREMVGNAIMNFLLFLAFLALIIPIGGIFWQVYVIGGIK